MLDFFHFLLIEPWKDGDIMGKFLGFLMAILTLIVVGLIGFLIFILVDSVGVVDRDGDGTVVNHQYHSAYTSMIMSGKVMVPVYHPARWELVFVVNDQLDGFDVSESVYKQVKTGEKFSLTYGKGRLSDELYIQSVNFEKVEK